MIKMAEKCILCNEKIENDDFGKIEGTVMKVKRDKKNKIVYACSECQKKHKEKLKEEAEKKA